MPSTHKASAQKGPPAQCYEKPDSLPSRCAVHDVTLVREWVQVDGKKIECWRCPRTEQVVDL